MQRPRNNSINMASTTDMATQIDDHQAAILCRCADLSDKDVDKIQAMIDERGEANLAAIREDIKASEDKGRDAFREIVREELKAAKYQTWREIIEYALFAMESAFFMLLYIYGALIVLFGILDFVWSYVGGKSRWSWGDKTIQ